MNRRSFLQSATITGFLRQLQQKVRYLVQLSAAKMGNEVAWMRTMIFRSIECSMEIALHIRPSFFWQTSEPREGGASPTLAGIYQAAMLAPYPLSRSSVDYANESSSSSGKGQKRLPAAFGDMS